MTQSSEKRKIRIQPRDEAILRGLLDSRLLTIKQAAALYFKDSFEAAKKRLQKLESAGYITKRPRKVQEPAIYSLARTGYMSLKEEGMLDPLLELGWTKMQERIRVSEFLLQHELAVVDVKTALVPSLQKKANLDLIKFSVNPEPYAFRATQAVLDAKKLVRFRSVICKPDGFFHVRTKLGPKRFRDSYFFLEVDRGTESLKRLVKKAQQYSQHYRRGGFAAKQGSPEKGFKRYPFRVLIIVQSAERINNVAETILKARTPVKTMIWLTTMSEVMANPLGAIWVRPADYLAAVHRTEFDPARRKNSPYRRSVQREEWVERRIRKQRLFK